MDFPIVVGQQVGIRKDDHFSKGVIVKVTPSGQIVVHYHDSQVDYRFNKDGVELGSGGRYYAARLVSVEAMEFCVKLAKNRSAMLTAFFAIEKKIGSYRNFTLGNGETYLKAVEELEVLVAEARKVAESF